MDPSGEHILHIAANCPHSGIIELLTRRWPSYINITNDDGITALHVASMYGQLSAVQVLVDNGADPFAVDNEGMTPLDCSINEGHTHCVEYFKSLGITPDKTIEEEQLDSMAIAYTSMETTLLDGYNDSTLSYTLNDITLVPEEEEEDLQQLTNSMLRTELVKLGEKPGPINELTRGAYLRYLNKMKNGLLPVQTQDTNSKFFKMKNNINIIHMFL